MPAEKYSKLHLKKQLPAKIKEHRREDDLDPTNLPSYDYLESKGFEPRGLTKAIQRHFDSEMTLHEFLREQGIGYDSGKWPTDHDESIKYLNDFIESRENRNHDRFTTISTVESALRVVLRIAQDLHGIENLFTFVRYDSDQEKFKRNNQIEEILDYIENNKSEDARYRYGLYFEKFYEYCKIFTRVDKNAVKKVRTQYDYPNIPKREPEPLSDEEIQLLWNTAKQLTERRNLTDSVKGLTNRYGIGKWQVYIMIVLLLGIGVGARSLEYERTNCQDDWKLNGDSFIEFPKRKNHPGEVPVMAHPEFLSAYCDYMEKTNDNWNGKPFPNPDSESGSIRKKTLNNWFKALCEEANVRLEDGSYPTLQNLRQTWHEEYLETLRIDDVRLELVAKEAGTKDPDQPKISYRSEEEERKAIRALASKEFEELVPLSELPNEMSRVIDDGEYFDFQTSLTDF